MTTNLFQRLRELVPQPPVLVGVVREHHDDDTSTVEIPGNLPLQANGADSLATGSLIRPRGTTVPVGKKAFVRAGVIETQAPDAEPLDIPVGEVIELIKTIASVRITALTAFPAYTNRNYDCSIYLRRISDGTWAQLQFSGQNATELADFNPNAFGDPSQSIIWGDIVGGSGSAAKPAYDVALNHSVTFPVVSTTTGGDAPTSEVFDGMYVGFTLSAFNSSTPLFHSGQIRIDLLNPSGDVILGIDYDGSGFFHGVKVAPNTGDPFEGNLLA